MRPPAWAAGNGINSKAVIGTDVEAWIGARNGTTPSAATTIDLTGDATVTATSSDFGLAKANSYTIGGIAANGTLAYCYVTPTVKGTISDNVTITSPGVTVNATATTTSPGNSSVKSAESDADNVAVSGVTVAVVKAIAQAAPAVTASVGKSIFNAGADGITIAGNSTEVSYANAAAEGDSVLIGYNGATAQDSASGGANVSFDGTANVTGGSGNVSVTSTVVNNADWDAYGVSIDGVGAGGNIEADSAAGAAGIGDTSVVSSSTLGSDAHVTAPGNLTVETTVDNTATGSAEPSPYVSILGVADVTTTSQAQHRAMPIRRSPAPIRICSPPEASSEIVAQSTRQATASSPSPIVGGLIAGIGSTDATAKTSGATNATVGTGDRLQSGLDMDVEAGSSESANAQATDTGGGTIGGNSATSTADVLGTVTTLVGAIFLARPQCIAGVADGGDGRQRQSDRRVEPRRRRLRQGDRRLGRVRCRRVGGCVCR